jgi:hypothetical protein
MTNRQSLPGDTPLSEGERVQVDFNCPDEIWRGATGFVVCLPLDDSGELGTGTYMIEFDEPVPFPNSSDKYTGAEILAEHLRRI